MIHQITLTILPFTKVTVFVCPRKSENRVIGWALLRRSTTIGADSYSNTQMLDSCMRSGWYEFIQAFFTSKCVD